MLPIFGNIVKVCGVCVLSVPGLTPRWIATEIIGCRGRKCPLYGSGGGGGVYEALLVSDRLSYTTHPQTTIYHSLPQTTRLHPPSPYHPIFSKPFPSHNSTPSPHQPNLRSLPQPLPFFSPLRLPRASQNTGVTALSY